ncbi:MAG: hypothetical protein K2M19_00585 [Muribaculaceae bacterium]|nr:hypothetical protein [Muribaculaceae bacterium]
MPTRNRETQTGLKEFPADRWVRFTIAGREYIGRAVRLERANVVASIDTTGKSVTFSWPYICDNVAGEVMIL